MVRYSDDLRGQIIKLRRAGLTAANIQRKLDVGEWAVRRWSAEAGQDAPNVSDKPMIGLQGGHHAGVGSHFAVHDRRPSSRGTPHDYLDSGAGG